MVLIQGESFQRANQRPYIPSPVDDNGGAWRVCQGLYPANLDQPSTRKINLI